MFSPANFVKIYKTKIHIKNDAFLTQVFYLLV